MTPQERAEIGLKYLRCTEGVAMARENGDVEAQRYWEGRRDAWRLLLREDLLAEPGPQGDAAP
jgi:hypothetical protein